MARRASSGETDNFLREIVVAIPDYETCMIPLLNQLADSNLYV